MEPLEFMQRLAALVPRPRLHLIRFHGVLAPNAKLRPAIVPSPPANTTDNPSGHGETLPPSAPVRLQISQRPQSAEDEGSGARRHRLAAGLIQAVQEGVQGPI